MHCRNSFSTLQDFNSWIVKKDPDIVLEEDLLNVLDNKSVISMSENGKYTKHTRHIARRNMFLSHGEKCKMHKIGWCEGGLQLADIATNIVGDHDWTPRMKYIMVRLENWDRTLVQ